MRVSSIAPEHGNRQPVQSGVARSVQGCLFLRRQDWCRPRSTTDFDTAVPAKWSLRDERLPQLFALLNVLGFLCMIALHAGCSSAGLNGSASSNPQFPASPGRDPVLSVESDPSAPSLLSLLLRTPVSSRRFAPSAFSATQLYGLPGGGCSPSVLAVGITDGNPSTREMYVIDSSENVRKVERSNVTLQTESQIAVLGGIGTSAAQLVAEVAFRREASSSYPPQGGATASQQVMTIRLSRVDTDIASTITRETPVPKECTNPRSLAADDCNGDGIADLIVWWVGSKQVHVISGCDLAVLQAFSTASDLGSYGAIIPDQDGDGIREFVILNSTDSNFSVVSTGGAGVLRDGVLAHLKEYPDHRVVSIASVAACGGSEPIIVAGVCAGRFGGRSLYYFLEADITTGRSHCSTALGFCTGSPTAPIVGKIASGDGGYWMAVAVGSDMESSGNRLLMRRLATEARFTEIELPVSSSPVTPVSLALVEWDTSGYQCLAVSGVSGLGPSNFGRLGGCTFLDPSRCFLPD